MLYQNEKIQYEIGSSLQQKLVELFDSCMTRHKIFIASFGEQDKEQLKKKKKVLWLYFFLPWNWVIFLLEVQKDSFISNTTIPEIQAYICA